MLGSFKLRQGGYNEKAPLKIAQKQDFSNVDLMAALPYGMLASQER
jgi:hypothetical protein